MIPNGTRFIGIAPEVDLKERGSALLNKRTEPYTIDDIRGYKVFTALLTQSGSDGTAQGISASPLTIGATYYIEDNGGSGWDFTNVGAPNNNLGTYFVATGTTPNSWGIDGQLGYTLGAPVATVLENTIGNIWFSYNGEGNYTINSDGLFATTNTFSLNNQTACFNIGGDSFYNLVIQCQNINELELATISDGFSTLDNQLTNKMIEIRVYN